MYGIWHLVVLYGTYLREYIRDTFHFSHKNDHILQRYDMLILYALVEKTGIVMDFGNLVVSYGRYLNIHVFLFKARLYTGAWQTVAFLGLLKKEVYHLFITILLYQMAWSA